MKPIYNEQGEIEDYSDEGEQVDKLNSEIDLYFLIKRLPPDEQKIAKMISDGFTWREIKKELKIGHKKITEVLKKLQAQKQG